MKRAQVLLAVVAFALTAGCASMGMNSVQKLNRLSPGMSSEEVQAILGEPKSSEVQGDKWILKYTLHENWKGFVPYYVVFNKDTRTLESWYADEEEYQRSQARMAETLKPLLEGQAGGGAAAPPRSAPSSSARMGASGLPGNSAPQAPIGVRRVREGAPVAGPSRVTADPAPSRSLTGMALPSP